VPPFDWQLIVALAAVAGAGWFLVRRGLTLLRSGKNSKPACGSCGSCATAPGTPPTASTGFVPLESLVRDDQK
jgi:hypothetical protein